MVNHTLGRDSAGGRRLAWAGGVLLGHLLLAAGAWAQQPLGAVASHRPAPAADAANPAAMAQAGGTLTPQMVLGAAVRVEIKDYEYLPATLTVPVGTTVTWTSHDDEPHTVTSSESLFASPGLDADEAFSYTFSKPGTYTYFCKLHPEMTATIIVK